VISGRIAPCCGQVNGIARVFPRQESSEQGADQAITFAESTKRSMIRDEKIVWQVEKSTLRMQMPVQML
jgi:hypothetical protein